MFVRDKCKITNNSKLRFEQKSEQIQTKTLRRTKTANYTQQPNANTNIIQRWKDVSQQETIVFEKKQIRKF